MSEGPEARLTRKMRKAAQDKYGSRFVSVKYHGSQFGEAGVSDLLCLLDGIFVAAEVKAPESYPVKGKPSVEKAERTGATTNQREFIRKVKLAGGVGGVVASVPHFLDLLAEVEEFPET